MCGHIKLALVVRTVKAGDADGFIIVVTMCAMCGAVSPMLCGLSSRVCDREQSSKFYAASRTQLDAWRLPRVKGNRDERS